MKKVPGLQDVNSDQQNGGLQSYLTYRQNIGRAPRHHAPAAGFHFVQRVWPATNLSHIQAIEPVLRGTGSGASLLAIARRVENIYLPNGHGNVPLNAVASLKTNTAPLSVAHSGLFPSVTVSFNLAEGLALSDATRMIQQMQEKLGTPSTIHGYFSGTLQAYQDSLGTQKILIAVALLAVYIVLGILYESLVHPLTIISTLLSASAGAMLALMIFHNDFNVISIIGIVLADRHREEERDHDD